ncbi:MULTISPECIES: hypothetical protein [unclassified Luteococcus]|uniref:hypothetical protein n=1 Tax=unclassified Luteococcus TaxID=2639923 RepID=UPI00313B4531
MVRRSTTSASEERDVRFSRALSEAIARQPLTLEQLTRRLREAGTPVSQATLSYWQRGRSLPTKEGSLEAIANLERILRMPVGHLTSALPHDAFSRWDFVEALPSAERARAVLDSMGLDGLDDFQTRYVHDDVRILADDQSRVETTRELVRASRDGIERTALLFLRTEWDADVPRIEPGVGCELGRVVDLDRSGFLLVELLLARRLDKGDDFYRSSTVHWCLSEPRASSDVQRVLANSIPFVILEASFEGAAPANAWYETTPYEFAPEDQPERLRQRVAAGPHLQVCLSDPPPGWHLMTWDFGGDHD